MPDQHYIKYIKEKHVKSVSDIAISITYCIYLLDTYFTIFKTTLVKIEVYVTPCD